MPTAIIKPLLGRTFAAVSQHDEDELHFKDEHGKTLFRFFYNPDCCARCGIDQIDGDLEDLCDSPITMAEYTQSETQPNDSQLASLCEKAGLGDNHDLRSCEQCQKWMDADADSMLGDSNTWTFVKLATLKGYVTIRWWGSSNGCYSELPTFEDKEAQSAIYSRWSGYTSHYHLMDGDNIETSRPIAGEGKDR